MQFAEEAGIHGFATGKKPMFFNSKKKDDGEFDITTLEKADDHRKVIDTAKNNHSSANVEDSK